jgi:hypothetical protein
MPVYIGNGNITTLVGANTLVSEAKYNGSIRAVMAITNTEAAGGNTCYISVGQEAVANKGIVLAPGQTWTWSLDSGYRPPLDRINAFCAAAITLATYEEIFIRNGAD